MNKRIEEFIELHNTNDDCQYSDSTYHDEYHDYSDSTYHDDYVDDRYDDRYTDGRDY